MTTSGLLLPERLVKQKAEGKSYLFQQVGGF